MTPFIRNLDKETHFDYVYGENIWDIFLPEKWLVCGSVFYNEKDPLGVCNDHYTSVAFM